MIIKFYDTTEKVGDLKVKCEYDLDKEEYIVTVYTDEKSRSRTFKRLGFEPRFGMDVEDWNHSYRVAEEIAVRFDKERAIK